MVSSPLHTAHQSEQTDDPSHFGAHWSSAMETTPDLSMKSAAHHRDGTPVSIRAVRDDLNVDDVTGSGSSDIEKTGVQDKRAYLFLGEPMSIIHELAFFAVVSTANFTPRKCSWIRPNPPSPSLRQLLLQSCRLYETSLL